jgi:hypothetical protein
LFVVADTRPAASPPRIVKHWRSGGSTCVEWDGEGDVFQLERAPGIFGPWLPCSPILPDLSFEDAGEWAGDSGFYLVRQW